MQDGLHGFAGFGEGDGLDELLRIDEASTVGKQQVLRFAQDDNSFDDKIILCRELTGRDANPAPAPS